MPYWKWALLLMLSLILVVILYGLAAMVDLMPPGWGKNLVFAVTAAAMVSFYALGVKLIEKHQPKDLPVNKLAAHTGMGLGIGLLYFCIVTGMMALCGCYRMTGIGSDATGIWNAFFLFLVVAVGEELLFRGVLFRWIDEKFGFAVALVASSLLFGLVHISNDNATWWSAFAIAIEAGLLLAAAYKWSGTLWLPIGIHWAWNFSQGNIFGFAVSGQQAGASLFLSQTQGSDWITGGAFGPEASVIGVLVGLALSAWFIRSVARK